MKIIRREIPTLAPNYLPHHHRVLRRIFAARHVSDESELDLSLARLPNFELLRGIQSAVDILSTALAEQHTMLILADYDVDGATGCVVLMRGLRRCGARQIDYLVPDRQRHGYGLSPEIAALIVQRQPDVLITTDNGITSITGVDIVRRAGIRVIITDHHLPGATLPSAHAIINPNQPQDAFPSKSIAGVGVAFYLLIALRAHLREAGWFAEQQLAEPKLSALLDLVALGTVADVVPLDHTNRIFVDHGLRRIRAGKCCAGISAIIQIARRAPHRLLSRDLGFFIAPRLNAAGRMANMRRGIECLLCDDFNQALVIAAELDGLNAKRQATEGEMRSSIEQWLQRLDRSAPDRRQASVCIYREDWHPGIIGILASRIKDRIARPVIAFAPNGDGSLKGSGRSVSSINIRDAIDAVNRQHPGMVDHFGGHAMAAGLTIKADTLEGFAAAFDTIVDAQLSAADREGYIFSDGPLQASDRNIEMAHRVQSAAPWGQGFDEPVFDDNFAVIARRVVGEKHLKLRLKDTPGIPPVPALAFNAAHRRDLVSADRLHIAYRLRINHYRGESAFELCIEHAEKIV